MQTFARTLLATGLVAAFAAAPFSQASAFAQTGDAAAQSDNQTVVGEANDGWITTKVKSEFATNSTVDATDIDVHTERGHVVLRGNVANNAERNAAETLARSVKGVTGVDASGLTVAGVGTTADNGPVDNHNDGRGIAATAQDAWITTKVKSEFAANDLVDATDIDVDTNAGKVTLHGNVSSTAEKNAAERVARSVKGVTAVDTSGLRLASDSDMDRNGNDVDDNQVSSIKQAGRGVANDAKDAWITTKVKSEFATNDVVDASDINVDTNGGTVTLNGNVSSAAEKAAAERVARSVKGVVSVDTSGLMVATGD